MVTKTQIKIDLKNAFEKLEKDDEELKLLFKNIEITNSITKAIHEVDAIGIVTDWDQFKKFNWESLQGSNIKIFDGRNVVDFEKAKISNFDIFAVY